MYICKHMYICTHIYIHQGLMFAWRQTLTAQSCPPAASTFNATRRDDCWYVFTILSGTRCAALHGEHVQRVQDMLSVCICMLEEVACLKEYL